MLHVKNHCRILAGIRTVSLFLVSALVLSACSSSHALAPWVASQSPVVKREIHAALQRTRIVYADSDDAKSLLKANNSDALLLSSGKYLVTKETADDAMRLVRAVVHEDIETMMQILEQDDRYRYNGIKELILSNTKIKQYYYDLCHNGREPRHLTPELLLNDIVAKALEIIFVAENGFVVREDYRTEDERLKEARFYLAIKPMIMANRHNYFGEGLYISPEDSRIRSESIRTALNKGFVFHQAAMPEEGGSGEIVLSLADIKRALELAGISPQAFKNLRLSAEQLKAITETITGSESNTQKGKKLLDILPGIIGRRNISRFRAELEEMYNEIHAITPEAVVDIKLLLHVFGWEPGAINRLSPRQAVSELKKEVVKHGVSRVLIVLMNLPDLQMIAKSCIEGLSQYGSFRPTGVGSVSEVTRRAAVQILRNTVAQARAKQGIGAEPKKKATIMIEPDVEIPEPLYECIRKVITMDFRDLVQGVDYDYTEGRSVYIKVSRILGRPLVIKGKTIRVIKLKGVCFNSDDRIVPYPRSLTITKVFYGPDGEVVRQEEAPDRPTNAGTMDAVDNEFELMDIAYKGGASVPMALGKAVYEDIEFQGKQLGVLILGIEKENEKDLRRALADLAGEGYHVPDGSFMFNLEPAKTRRNKDKINSLIRRTGREYRKLHNCGVIQHGAHALNVLVASDGTVRLEDFEIGVKLENPTVAQDVAHRLNDFRAFFQMLAANLDQGLIYDLKNIYGINIHRELLAGYLGEYAREGAFSYVDDPIEIRRVGGVRRYVYECKIGRILSRLHHDRDHINRDPLLVSMKALVEADRRAAGTRERTAPGGEESVPLDEVRRVLLENGVAQKVVDELSEDELRRIVGIARSGANRDEKTADLFTILHSGRISRKNADTVLTRLEIMGRTPGPGAPAEALRTIYQEFGFRVFHGEELYPLRKPYASSTVDVEIRMLEKLGVLLPVIKDEDKRKKYHRLNESIRGATSEETENNIRNIYNIKLKTSKRGRQHPLDRYSIPDDKIPAVRERVKIELLHRHSKMSDKGRVTGEQCLIKAWNGYGSPGYQKGMLTRIHNITEKGPYKVDFREGDSQELVDFALTNKNNTHVITILPYNKLTEEQVKKLINAEAQVIFMDFEKEELTGFDLSHIGGIIAAGISYLNNNDLAFMNIYRLLTDDNEHLSITVEEFKGDPTKLKFILKPVEILDAEDLRNLHNRMEQLLTAA